MLTGMVCTLSVMMSGVASHSLSFLLVVWQAAKRMTLAMIYRNLVMDQWLIVKYFSAFYWCTKTGNCTKYTISLYACSVPNAFYVIASHSFRLPIIIDALICSQCFYISQCYIGQIFFFSLETTDTVIIDRIIMRISS